MTENPQTSGGRRASLDRVERALRDAGLAVRSTSANSLMAQCPVHNEKTGSLNITWQQDAVSGGKTLLFCHGCRASGNEIAEAIGLTLGDLFDEPKPEPLKYEPRTGRSYRQRQNGQRRGRLGKLPKPIVPPRYRESNLEDEHHWRVVKTYPYVNAAGELVEEVLREECEACATKHKQFRQLFVVDGGRRKRKPEGFRPVLFRMPQVVEAITEGKPVWLLEGEKDVETAESLGLVATTNAQGSGSFPAELAEVFTDADLRIVLDRDDAGWSRGVALHELLQPLAAHVTLYLPATTEEKSDFTDHVEAGHEVADLVQVHVTEVTAWSLLAQVRKRHAAVETALNESLAQKQAADEVAATKKAPAKAEEHARFAKRWAVESEIRCESLVEKLNELREVAELAASEWAIEALTEAEEAHRQALVAARTTHHTLGLPIPPLLQEQAAAVPPAAAPVEEPPFDEEPPPPLDDEPPMTQGLKSTLAAGGQLSKFGAGDGEVRTAINIDQPVFRIVNGQIVMVDRNGRKNRNDRWDEEGSPDDENLKLILGLDVRIVEMEYLEEDKNDEVDAIPLMGRESTEELVKLNPAAPKVLSAVVITFTHPDSHEQMMLRIKADEWRDGTWLEALPGNPDYDAKPSGLATIRRAIKSVSEDIKTTERFRWTGWRRDPDGNWMFVHARAAIGPEGSRPAPVLLSGPLARYDLPDPTMDPKRLRAAFMDGSGSFMTKLPRRVAAPLLGHTYRSALGVNPWVLVLVGSPGSYKTSVASLAMHHWGEQWDRRKPATSMSGNGGTLNALRIQLNRAKDALFWADDVAPTKDWSLAQKNLEEFARMVHNAEERTRAERDGQGVLDGTVPRASAMVTSEVMPRPGSGADRMLVVPFRKEDINLPNLIELDGVMSRHHRAVLMASFLQWLARDISTYREEMKAEVVRYAEQLRNAGQKDRAAESVANTWAGWVMLTRFLLEVGAITEEERDAVLEQADLGLHEAIDAALDPDLPTRTGARVRELLAHALRTGVAYVDDVETGECPEWPLAGRLGWRRQIMNVDEFGKAKYRYDPKGIKLGWVLTTPPNQGKVTEQLLYIESTAALEQILQQTAKAMNDAPQMDRGTAVRALYDEGLLIAEETTGKPPRMTTKRSVPCEQRRPRVTVLRLAPLLGEDDAEDGDVPFPDGDGGGPADGGPHGGTGGGWDDVFNGGPATPAPDVDVPDTPDVVSEAPPTLDLTSPHDEETSVSTYTDLDGTAATLTILGYDSTCIACGVVCGVAFHGYPMHVLCWQNSSAATRSQPATSAATAPAPAAPTQAAKPGAPTEEAPKSAPPAPRKAAPAKSSRLEAASEQFVGPAAILDVDGIWMPDGTKIERPAGLRHVGQLADLVDDLRLGTQVTARKSWPGQIWVTAEALPGFGIEMDPAALSSDTRERSDQLRAITKGTPFVDEAIADGWKIGGAGDALATWTRVWRPDSERRGVWITLMVGMDHTSWRQDSRNALLRDNPEPSSLARRLSLFADALHAPFTMSTSTTGLDLMVDLRARDRDRMFAPAQNLPEAAEISTTENDINWSRTLTEAETGFEFIHAYDRSGSYAAGMAGLELPIGEPVHHPDGMAFDRKLPGYWLVNVPKAGDWRMPHPLNPRGGLPIHPVWFTTPTLEFAFEQGYEPEILEAYVWPEHGRVLDPFYDRIRDARGGLDTPDADAQVARDLLKGVYTNTIGMLGSQTYMKGRKEYAPHRRHHIVAKARANIMRRVVQIGRDADVWPVAVSKDSILYVSNEADPIKAWPGKPEQLGRGFGQYRPEASGLLVDQAKFLNGHDYRGMKALKGPDADAED